MMQLGRTVLLGLLVPLLLLGPARAEDRPAPGATWSLEDLAALVRLSQPALSPEGALAAVVVSRPVVTENRFATTLVVVDTVTGTERVVAHGEVASPAWSPRGRELAWLAPDAHGSRQIVRLRMDAAAAAPVVVTHAAAGAGVRAFAFSPDGESIAYLAAQPPVAPVGTARFDHTFEALDGDYLGTSYLTRTRGPGPACVWMLGGADPAPRMLTCAPAYIEALAFGADGRTVIVSSHPGTSIVSARFGSVSAVEVDSGRTTLRVPPPANVATDAPMRVSSTGSLAYPHYRGPDPWLHQLNVSVVTDGAPREATAALDRNVLAYAWLPDGQALLVEVQEGVRKALLTVGLEGAVRRLTLGDVNPTDAGLAVSRQSGTIAFIGTEPASAAELYVLRTPASAPTRLTRLNGASRERRLGAARTITWTQDGYEQDGILTYPPDARPGQRYPMLVAIHGGPHTSAELTFNPESQYYAAHGWLVFEPNYRGSDGHGERYRTAVVGDATPGPGRDLAAGIAAVQALGIVEAARVALTGYSYGGVMTAWMIGQHPDWCAAIAGGVVVDFKGYYDQSDTGIWIGSLLGSPHVPGNRERYVAQSPTTYLAGAKTPTLILQNVGDDNAPVAQAYELFHALRDNGTSARLITYDVEGHDPHDPYRERQMLEQTLAWMTGHCAPGRP